MLSRFVMRSALLGLAALMPFACAQDTTSPGHASAALVTPGLVSLEWQQEARNLVAANRLSPLAGGRAYAALSVAQHRAIKKVDLLLPTDPAEPDMGFGQGGRKQFEARRGAVAAASARVLGFLFPAAGPALDQKVIDQGNAGGQSHAQFTRGVAIGRNAGDAMVEHLQSDGFTRPWTGTVPVGPGLWIPNSLPPAGGTLSAVTPYFLSSGSQFRPAPPPAFGSATLNTDLNEVLARAQNRTPAELALAIQWDYPAGTPTPLGYWNAVAAGYVGQSTMDERAATEVFSLMHAAMFDSLIGCWDAKYFYWTLRPTQANPAIPLAFALPNHPSYPSGHSCISAAADRVLMHYFPDKSAELAGWVSDAGLSRIIAGIHYRFDVTAGQALGVAVANLAISRGTP
jgi:hypothetical protein